MAEWVIPQPIQREPDQEKLKRLAEQGVRDGEPGEFFAQLHRRGWRPASQLEGDGLEPCPDDCGVCHPEPSLRQVKRRRKVTYR
jgi:hypothetical protein